MYTRCFVALVLATAAIPLVSANAQDAAPAQVATAEPTAATPIAEPPAPATAVVPEPQDPLGIALKERLEVPAPKGDDQYRADLEAMKVFYGGRTYAPLWITAETLNAKAQAAIAEIKKAEDWGLDVSAFTLPALATSGAAPTPAALAEAEVILSEAVLAYARHARGGRIMNPAGDLSSYLDRTPQLLDPQTVLSRIATADAPDAVLRGFHPQHPQFEKLRQAYLAMRDAAAAVEIVRLPDGPMLRPGTAHADIPLLRKRLKVALPAAGEGGAPVDETFYDDALKTAVMAFQKERGLSPDGLVGPGTRVALNEIEAPSTERLLVNMEQWRWMPEDMGDFYVWVNVPEFTLRVVKNGEVIHTERVITGLIDKQTPIFSENLKEVIFQPRWNVPDSIKVNELYPSLARGGVYFQRQGLRLSQNGRRIDPESVDWSSADIRRFDIYQPPGPGNVLGEVKFAFPNKHLVYMHDTPTKHLFEQASRPFSHGCMRVRNPRRLAEVLLAEDRGWDAAKVAELIEHGPEDNHLEVTRTIPVHVSYFTAWVDDAGATQVARDVYGHEKRITLALAGKWQQIAKGPNHLAPVRLNRVEDDGFFFFGGGGKKKPASVGDLVQSILGGF
jgi:murein L,D-transpeptidase YcbB/YkuD